MACARNCPVNAIVGERKMAHVIDTLNVSNAVPVLKNVSLMLLL